MFPQLPSREPDVHVDPDLRTSAKRTYFQRVKDSGAIAVVLNVQNANRREVLGRILDSFLQMLQCAQRRVCTTPSYCITSCFVSEVSTDGESDEVKYV
jgi:hypothetical protein